jgi:hypothetical protein
MKASFKEQWPFLFFMMKRDVQLLQLMISKSGADG